MKKFYGMILAMVMMLTAANVAVLDNSKFTGYDIRDNADDYLEINFSVGSIRFEDIETERGVFTKLRIENGFYTYDEGAPELPRFHELIAMPYGAEPQVKVLSYKTKVYKLSELGINHPVYPAQPSYSKSSKPEERVFVYNENAYKTSKHSGKPQVTVEKSGTMRGVGVGRIEVCPFSYNAEEGTIEVYNDVQVRVNFIGAHPNWKEKAAEQYSPYFESSLKELINYKDLSYETKTDLTKYPITYLILSNDNLNGNADLNSLIAWKKEKGFTVYTNFVAASSSIENNDSWIENQYANLNPKPSFVLIIGDHDGTYGVLSEVNPALGSANNVTRSDLLYGVIGTTGSSNRIPSMHVGRMSVRTLAQLTAQVDKTIWYEKDQFLVSTPDLDYLTRTLGVAGHDNNYAQSHGNPHINYGWNHYFNSTYGMANAIKYLYPESSSSATAIRNDVSVGTNFFQYTAHGNETSFGDPQFTIAQVYDLNNSGKYPLVIGNCCLTASFGTVESFGEAWLNAPNKGGIGFIGASMNTYWNEDLAFGVGTASVAGNQNPPLSQDEPGCYDGLMMQNYPTQAGMKHVSLLAVERYGGTRVDWYWSSYHLFGDPSLMVYFGIPSTQTASHDGVIPPGVTSFTVSTTPYAYVAMGDQNGVLHGAARANAAGTAVVPISPYTVGDTAKLVITAQFRQPYFEDILCTGDVGGTFSYSPTSLSYGTVQLGSTSIKTFGITNSHSVEYILGDITAIDGYTVSSSSKDDVKNGNVLSYSVAPNSTRTFDLAFAPIESKAYDGNITITSSDTNNALKYVSVTGAGFTTIATPNLLSPSNTTESSIPNPEFSWSSVSGATGYQLVIDDDADFSSPLIDNNTASTTYTPTGLPIGTYYWKVRAFVNSDFGEFTSPWSVTIVPYELPFSEDFNASTSLPTAWSIVDHQGNGQVWQFGTHASGLTGTTGNYAYLNSDAYGSGNSQNADLVTPTINMSNATDVRLEFTHYFRAYSGSSATLSYSINDGASWNVIQTVTATTANPASFSQIITAVSGQPAVKFKWNFTGTWGYYWDVDDVLITGTSTAFPSMTLSANSINSTAEPNGSDNASFDIGNTGDANLTYSISHEYSGSAAPGGTWHSNDFESGLVYTNSGGGNWTTGTGGAWNGNTTCAVAALESTSIMTSAGFDTTPAATALYLDFDYTYTHRTNASGTVAYYNGSSWVNVWTVNATNSGHVQVELPAKAANTQIRVTGVMTKVTGQNSAFRVDNIVVSSSEVPYTWLVFNSGTSGSIVPAGSTTVNMTCDAAGLAAGTYNANITIASNDPVEPNKIIPVEFIVTSGGELAAPENISVVTATEIEVNLGWDAVSGATIYHIYRSTTDPYGGFLLHDSTSGTSYQDTDVLTGNKYFYYITSDSAK